MKVRPAFAWVRKVPFAASAGTSCRAGGVNPGKHSYGVNHGLFLFLFPLNRELQRLTGWRHAQSRLSLEIPPDAISHGRDYCMDIDCSCLCAPTRPHLPHLHPAGRYGSPLPDALGAKRLPPPTEDKRRGRAGGKMKQR